MAQADKKSTIAGYFKKFGVYFISLLGAAGTGLQNYMAVAALIKDLMTVGYALTKGGMAIIHTIAIAFGGLCSGLVNLCINIGLLESFLERITDKGCDLFLMLSPQDNNYKVSDKNHLYLYGNDKGAYFYKIADSDQLQYLDEEESEEPLVLSEDETFISTNSKLVKCKNTKFIKAALKITSKKGHTSKKMRVDLQGWQRFRYWFGSSIFIVTGILFGLTAFAFGPIGALAVVSIAAGIFVAGIMMIQELETWLQSFDEPGEKKSIKAIFKEWKDSLTKGKVLGIVIAVGNVVALSLLFTMGLASFLVGMGVPALPALIVGFGIAFTGGAFTEFYFYNRFLSDFCHNFKTKWQEFKETKYPVVGMACGVINALVNGVLSYIGIMMITSLIMAAGIACPPIGAMIAVAVIAATFAALASFVLGLDFWINNSKKLTGYFAKEKPIEADAPAPKGNTTSIKLDLKNSLTSTMKKKKEEERKPLLENEMTEVVSDKKGESGNVVTLSRSSLFQGETFLSAQPPVAAYDGQKCGNF